MYSPVFTEVCVGLCGYISVRFTQSDCGSNDILKLDIQLCSTFKPQYPYSLQVKLFSYDVFSKSSEAQHNFNEVLVKLRE